MVLPRTSTSVHVFQISETNLRFELMLRTLTVGAKWKGSDGAIHGPPRSAIDIPSYLYWHAARDTMDKLGSRFAFIECIRTPSHRGSLMSRRMKTNGVVHRMAKSPPDCERWEARCLLCEWPRGKDRLYATKNAASMGIGRHLRIIHDLNMNERQVEER